MRSSLSLLLGLALCGPAAAQPTRLVSQVDDAYALHTNPAGLALAPGGELRANLAMLPKEVYQYETVGTYALLSLGRLALGGGLDLANPKLSEGRRYGFGLAARLGAASGLGLSWTRSDLGGGPRRGQLNLGLSLRPVRWLGLGAAMLDVTDHAERQRWSLGLTLRPFDWLRLSGQWRSKAGAQAADYRGMLELEPWTGVRMGGGVDQDGEVFGQLSFGFSFTELGAELQSAPRLYTEVSVHGRRPSALGPSVSLAERSRPRVAVMDLAGDLLPEAKLELLRGGVRYPPYGEALLALHALATAPDVDGVLLRIRSLSVGWAKVEGLRAAITQLRAAGRPVDCMLLADDDLAYFLAAACRSVSLTPAQQLRVNGVEADALFFGQTLVRAGVRVEVSRRGAYKSAPETLTRAGISPAQAESMGAYLDTVESRLEAGIAEGRGLSPAKVTAALDRGIMTATTAVELGLADEVLYPDQLEAAMLARYGRSPRFLPLSRALPPQGPRWGEPDELAIVHVDRAITAGASQDGVLGFARTLGGDSLVKTLDKLRDRRGVKAVVLRVDSPGGDAVASDMVARAVQRLAAVKPVIASFGDVAASGGYYVAAPAKAIYAAPTTLTGSIGVFALKPSLQGLREKLGVGAARLSRGGPKLGSVWFDGSPEERALWERGVEAAYQRFLQVVADGRHMSKAEVKAVAEGRIWSGADAKTRGLVDALGGLNDAIARAKKEAKLRGPVRLVNYPRSLRPLTSQLAQQSPTAQLATALPGLGPLLQHSLPWLSLHSRVAALPPLLLSLR